MSNITCDCGGTVARRTGPGRKFEYVRGVFLDVPDDVPTVMCSQCGSYFLGEESDDLERALKPLYAARQRALCQDAVGELIRRRPGTTYADIERAARVTPTYLSHVLAGRKAASETLVALIEVLALCPEQFDRLRDGGTFAEGLTSQISKIEVGTFAEAQISKIEVGTFAEGLTLAQVIKRWIAADAIKNRPAYGLELQRWNASAWQSANDGEYQQRTPLLDLGSDRLLGAVGV